VNLTIVHSSSQLVEGPCFQDEELRLQDIQVDKTMVFASMCLVPFLMVRGIPGYCVPVVVQWFLIVDSFESCLLIFELDITNHSMLLVQQILTYSV
jgi:hypothetical protein